MAAVEVFQHDEPVVEARANLRLVSVSTIETPLRTGPSLARRRAARARMLQRRRRTLVALAVIVGLVILAFPGHAFGGVTGAGLPTDLADSSVLASGMSYVVQPGDTVSSIARLMNPLDPSHARSELVHQLESKVVVPGEHIVIP